MPLFRLSQSSYEFPKPEQALSDPSGLLAIGGDLQPQRLLAAYCQGIFPWSNPSEPLLWWSPDPRGVFFLDRMHFSQRLYRQLKHNEFHLSLNQGFAQVVAACAQPRPQQTGTWILDELQRSYAQLHQQGFAHSIEVWQQQQLVGGVFGIALGRVFVAESMFSRQANTSKLALLALRRHLLRQGYQLIDSQFCTPHLASLGATEVRRSEYLALLQQGQLTHTKMYWPKPHNQFTRIESSHFAMDPDGVIAWDF